MRQGQLYRAGKSIVLIVSNNAHNADPSSWPLVAAVVPVKPDPTARPALYLVGFDEAGGGTALLTSVRAADPQLLTTHLGTLSPDTMRRVRDGLNHLLAT